MQFIRNAICLLIMTASLSPVLGQDTVHIRAGAPGWGTNVGVSPLYTLGGAPDYRIRNFYGIAVDRANRVYIHDLNAQEGNPRVDAYDANGNFIKTFGHKGSGPGEYRTIFGMTVIQDSIVAALDLSNARITEWFPDGSLVRTIPLEKSYTGGAWYALSSDTANLLYLWHRIWLRGPDGRAARNQPPEEYRVYVRLRPDGTIADSISAPKIDTVPARSLTYGGYISWNNFVPDVWITPHTMGGLVYGRGDSYRFTIQPANRWAVSDSRASAGSQSAQQKDRRPVIVVERDWKPVPLTSEEREEWTAYGDIQKNRDGSLGGYTVPKTKPAYQRLFVDADGRTWVSLYAPATKRQLPERDPKITSPRIQWLQQPVYDVFDSNGRYLANVTLPYRTGDLVQARGDRVWFFGVGAEDEHLITAYKLTGIKGR